MTSATSILTTIDDVIRRVNAIEVCQNHFKLITNSLTRLRQCLNENVTKLDESHLQEDIEQILKVIDEIIISCSEDGDHLNGVTYRDLESILFRLQFRLAYYETCMTGDYEMKVQILSDTYSEQQLLEKKSLDQTIMQRCEVIERQMKESVKEKFLELNEKYAPMINAYGRTCIKLHKSVPFTILTGDIGAKAANNFYTISYKERMQLEHKWRPYKLPLTQTFIRLKPDKSTSFERNESRRLLLRSEHYLFHNQHGRKEPVEGIWRRLVSAPYMMSMIERNREDDVTIENIIRTKRWIVILGDPGSGKTSFVQWLVHHLAQTFINGQHSTDYEPVRIPILIQIGEFAEILKDNPSLTLFDYIGKHKWMGKIMIDDSSISLDHLSRALQDYIQQGQALIILDGLDEVPVSCSRSKIINLVENFVDTYVQIPTDVSAFDNVYLSKLLDEPSRSGGNQLIVTSRIVGYHAAPLAGQFAHYTIQPMDMKHTKDFVDYWFFHVHQYIIDGLSLPLINQGGKHSEALKNELEKSDYSDLLDMTSNIGIASCICEFFFSQLDNSSLHIQRFILYDKIIDSMLTAWVKKRMTIEKSELIKILTVIASHIHQYSESNLINYEEINDICTEIIKTSLDTTLFTPNDSHNIEMQVTNIAQIIREDAGMLTLRGESLYGFLYPMFQDYFTCLKLIEVDQSQQNTFMIDGFDQENNVQFIAQSLRYHADNPQFRIPIMLALGQLSFSWSREDFNQLCHEFVKVQDEFGSLFPLGAYILITSINDLAAYPANEILFEALDRLISAAAQYKWSIVCPFLFGEISKSLIKLPNEIVSSWIHNLLSKSSSHDIQVITALCHFLEGKFHEFENIKWLNQSSCSMLQSLSIFDNENNQFAIDRLLIKVAFSNYQLLPSNPTSFKQFLLDNEIEWRSIPVSLFPLIIILYGGLKRDNQNVIFDPRHIHRESIAMTPLLIKIFSEREKNKQEQYIGRLKQECVKAFVNRIQNHDESSETIDLCIATICFYDIEYVQENLKIIPNSFLRLIMNRLKYALMLLRQFYFPTDEDDQSIEKEATKFISMAVEKFQYVRFPRVHFLELVNLLRRGLACLRSSRKSILLDGISESDRRITLNLPNSLRKEGQLLDSLLTTDVQLYSDRKSCSLLYHFNKLFWSLEHNKRFNTQYRMAIALDTVPEYLTFRHDEDLLFPLIFVPSHLRNLYIQLIKNEFIIIKSDNSTIHKRQHLYFGHILTECLIYLSNSSCKRLALLGASVALLPWLRMQQLENFGSSLLWSLAVADSPCLDNYETQRHRRFNERTGRYRNRDQNVFKGKDIVDEHRRALVENYIGDEYERLQNVSNEDDTRNMNLYSISVTLARICRWTEDERRLFLLKQSINGAMSIQNKLARLDAICVIAFYSHTDFEQIRLDRGQTLQEEIEFQFNEIYPTLPSLLHAAIFLRCLPLLESQITKDRSLENLFDKFDNTDRQDQEVINEALLPYIQSINVFTSIKNDSSDSLLNNNKMIHDKSSMLKKYLHISTDEDLSLSIFISNLYLTELVNDFHQCIQMDNRQLTIDDSILTKLLQFDSCTLTEEQALTITNILYLASSIDQFERIENVLIILSNALHRIHWVEFKAFTLLGTWLKWKDSNKFCSFAYHAALLLINSDSWTVETVTVACDLLCIDNDRFRQRAETVFRSSSDDNVWTSSKLGIDVLLALLKRKFHYQIHSPSVNLTLNRMLGRIIVDIQSHLETILWLERYRIHALVNKEYSLRNSSSWINSYITSLFSTDIPIDSCFCVNVCQLSGDLVTYMCDLIGSSFFSFLAIDGDTTSNAVLESHTQFIVSVIVTLNHLLNSSYDTRQLAIETLVRLLEISDNDEVRRAAVYALGYVCNQETYKVLFGKIRLAVDSESQENSSSVLIAMISSYAHCISVNEIVLDPDDIDLFFHLLTHPSQDVIKATRTGLGRSLKDTSFLIDMLGFDYIQCYHALIGSTAYLFIHSTSQNSENAIAEFIEEHPGLLPIFIIELYNSIRYFTSKVLPLMSTNYALAYAYPQHVRVAALIAERMPVAFCTYIKDWHDGDNLKRALFYTSQQHNFVQRAACLKILSSFGELTVELCEMFIKALYDDPWVQNTCYKCLRRISSIRDEKTVLNLLLSHLKSKSMNVRYATTIIFLHLLKSSLISSKQVRTILNDLISDSTSNEDLWLIEEQDSFLVDDAYYNAGPLNDVVYSLLIQYLTGNKSKTIPPDKFDDIDWNFIEAGKSSRLASCLFEARTIDGTDLETFQISDPLVDNNEDSRTSSISLSSTSSN